MELYQAFADCTEMIDDHRRADHAGRDRRDRHVGGDDRRRRQVDLAEPWRRARMIDLVGEAIGVEVHPSHAGRRRCARSPTSTASAYEPSWGSGKIIEELFEATVRGRRSIAADVRHRPSGRDLAARPRRSQRPVPHRALRAVRRRARAGQRLQRAQRPGRAAAALRGRAGRQGRRRRRSAAPSTRTTCGRSSTACRRRAGSGIGMDRVAMLIAGVDIDQGGHPVPDPAPGGDC